MGQWVRSIVQVRYSTINAALVRWGQLFNAEVIVIEFRLYQFIFPGSLATLQLHLDSISHVHILHYFF